MVGTFENEDVVWAVLDMEKIDGVNVFNRIYGTQEKVIFQVDETINGHAMYTISMPRTNKKEYVLEDVENLVTQVVKELPTLKFNPYETKFKNIVVTDAMTYSFPIRPADIGLTFNYNLRLWSYSPNTAMLVAGSLVFTTAVMFSLPGAVTSATVVAADNKITVGWSAPSGTDGDCHASNGARITITTAGGCSRTADATGGSYVATGLTNGALYTVSILAQASSPLGDLLTGWNCRHHIIKYSTVWSTPSRCDWIDIDRRK